MIIKRNEIVCDSSYEFTLRIVSSGDAFFGDEWRALEPSPPFSRLYFILDGEGKIECKDGTYRLKKNNLYLLPAGYGISYSCQSQMHQLYFHILFSNRSGYDILRETGKILSIGLAGEEANEILRLYKSEKSGDILALRSALVRYVTRMLNLNGVIFKRKSYSECVGRAMEIIEKTPDGSLSVADIAERCFVSADTLMHRFKREVGISVGKYIDDIVMFRAEQMLVGSDRSISDISNILGFCDQFYFSRKFKMRYGIPPQKYRSERRK